MNVPPHLETSERVLLSSLYWSAIGGEPEKVYDVVARALDNPSALFWDVGHREAWRRMETAILDGRNVTAGLLVKHTDDLPLATVNAVTDPGWVMPIGFLESRYLPELIGLADARRAAAGAARLVCDLEAPGVEPRAAIKSAMPSFDPTPARVEVDVKRDAARAAIADWEFANAHPGELTGIASGLVDLDHAIWGWQKQNFIVIGARPSQGKSAMIFQFADHAAVDLRVPTLVFTLESSAKEAVKRMVTGRARVDQFRLRAGEMTQGEGERLIREMAKVTGAPLWFVDTPGMSIGQIQQEARRFVFQRGVRLIFMDYVQKARADVKNEKRTYEVAQVTDGLKTMAKEHDLPVIAAAQLNREPDKGQSSGRAPRLSDFGDSGQIERDADICGLIWHNQAKDKPIKTWLLIAKNRDGPTNSVPLYFNKPFARFENASAIEEEDARAAQQGRNPHNDD